MIVLAPILKKRKPRVKIEPKLEGKQEVKVKWKVEAEVKEEEKNAPSSSVPVDMSNSSMKRKSSELDDEDEQARFPPEEVDQVSMSKKVKTSCKESMGPVAGSDAGELAPEREIDQTTAENENHVTHGTCRGEDEWEGFGSE